MIIGHVGARKGSQGVAGKNFLEMPGKLLPPRVDRVWECLVLKAGAWGARQFHGEADWGDA